MSNLLNILDGLGNAKTQVVAWAGLLVLVIFGTLVVIFSSLDNVAVGGVSLVVGNPLVKWIIFGLGIIFIFLGLAGGGLMLRAAIMQERTIDPSVPKAPGSQPNTKEMSLKIRNGMQDLYKNKPTTEVTPRDIFAKLRVLGAITVDHYGDIMADVNSHEIKIRKSDSPSAQ